MAKRDYNNDYPSVTTVLGVLRKIGLENWFKINTPQFIQAESAKGKLIGTQIHTAIQSFIETGKAKIETEHNLEVMNALNSFMAFRIAYPHINLHKAEVALTSEAHKFNGTIDCIGDGIIVDWKTSQTKDKDKPTVYDEYKFQVSAYVHLWNECHAGNIDKAIIVSIAKDKVAYQTHEMEKEEIDFWFNEVFLSALKIVNAQKRKEFTNGYVPREETSSQTTFA